MKSSSILKIRGLTEADPNGIPQHAPGAKLDDGKPWVSTVLRGFWPVVRETYIESVYLGEADLFFGSPRHTAIARCVNLGSIHGPIKVGTFGAQKYSRDGWQYVPDGVARYDEAAGRHMLALLDGEDRCPDSGLHHYDHFAWNVLACAVLMQREKQSNDSAGKSP